MTRVRTLEACPALLAPAAALTILLAATVQPRFAAAQASGAPGLMGRWLGQDGHDRVGPSSNPGPSDVQDIHIALMGVPTNRKVVTAKVAAQGGGEWVFNGPHGPWRVEVVQEPGSRRVDLFLEPAQVETGRAFAVTLTLDDGRELNALVAGGRADPNLRMPGAALAARWIGQEDTDQTGLGPSVGPDGIVDARVALAGLSPRVDVRTVAIDADGLPGWRHGVNPEGRHDARFTRQADDPSRADLHVTPDADLRGRTLTITVEYTNGKTDTTRLVAGTTDPNRRVPIPELPREVAHQASVNWLGQDGSKRIGPGDVHLALRGLPRDRAIVAAILSGGSRGVWFRKANDQVRVPSEPFARPLEFVRDRTDPTRADVFFPPVRDERDATMTLRLEYGDGTFSVVGFPGGGCDPALRMGLAPPSRTVSVRPGDDLNAHLSGPADLRLTRGTYRLRAPLVLRFPTRLSAEDGVILLFEQPSSSPPWREAISIRSGGVTLESLAIRFAGPIRWEPGIAFGPAVIGTASPAESGSPMVDLRIHRLDLESPPATDPNRWEEAARLLRLTDASGGRIERCTLRGGPIELVGGPWQVIANESLGTPPALHSPAVIAAHDTHDLLVRDHRVRPSAGSGKTWRFLVLTGSGARDVVEGNAVEGVGPRDDDTIPNMNAPELILTESYRLKFEGRPLVASPGGRIVRIPEPQGGSPAAGDVLAVLTGPSAGQWSRIAQAIDATTCLLESPIEIGNGAVSIATGFVGETFVRNQIDARRGSGAVHLVLGGNHFGTRVVENRLVGAGGGFKITATPTESPVFWGWSRAPMFDLLIERNTLVDPLHGGLLAVEHGPAIKTNRGRVYLTGTLRENVLIGTSEFAASWGSRASSPAPRPIDVGDPAALDPEEIRVEVSGNRVEAAPSSGLVVAVNLRLGQRDRSGAKPR